MLVLSVMGLLLTVLAVALIGVGGYLAALLALPRRDDPLLLAVTACLLATAEAVAVALLLGAIGLLRVELALALQLLLVYLPYRRLRRADDLPDGLGGPARRIAEAAWRHLRAFPALSLIAVHAIGLEAVRGLLRPPLSWDSLMYHLYLAATWLQEQGIALVGARQPTAAYLFAPADGSLWLWWWMAPSHSELFANLAFVPHWAWLGLATGAFARELGACRYWPVAGFLTLLTPAVLRFAATQYVDVTVAAALVTASLFALRWSRRPALADALLVGAAMGLAAGTKVIGLPFGAALAGLAVLLARGEWRRRIGHLAAAGIAALPLGGYFYLRNLALGAGPFGGVCVSRGAEGGVLASLPTPHSLAARWGEITGQGLLTDAFFGSTRPTLADLGIGPQVVLLALAALALPFVLRRARPAAADAAWLASGQIAVQLAFWAVVPSASGVHILANVRYLDGALALGFAGAVALAEDRLADRWLRGLAVALAIQDLLMVRPALPRSLRLLLAAVLVIVVVLALRPAWRGALRRRWKPLAAAAALALLSATPFWARYRIEGREHAFRRDLTAHLTSSRIFAGAWGWLDANGGDGTVAVVHEPENYFVYPAMGPFLERRAVYVHVNREAHRNPTRYPGCDVRVDPSPVAWLANLEREGVRWLHVARFPEVEMPLEDRWARSMPGLFRLAYEDATNRVYSFGPPGPAGPVMPPAAPGAPRAP